MLLFRFFSLIIFLFSVALHATDDFDLPPMPEKDINKVDQELNTKDFSEKPIQFAPIETSTVSTHNESDSSTKIILKKIPLYLNRPIRVGLFFNEKEIFVKHNNEEYYITTKDGNLKINNSKSKQELVKTKTFNQIGKGTLVSINKKTLSNNCYPGELKIIAQKNSINVINYVEVEEYLRGVIPYEIGKLDESRFSALESQAIAARTYAYKHFGSRESLGFDVYADTKDQVYKGLIGATSLTDSAVKKTNGIVMTYNGEFIIAYYHSTCGGKTETLATWGRENLPYLQSKDDLRSDGTPYCKNSSYIQWERKYSDKELNKLFKQNAKDSKIKIPDFKEIESISILDTLNSGRILTLEVCTDKGVFQVMGDKIRWLFKKNGSILPSSFFRIGFEDSNWVLQGKGFGHGVGMCQMGARERAFAGENFITILTHYYPGITLERYEK